MWILTKHRNSRKRFPRRKECVRHYALISCKVIPAQAGNQNDETQRSLALIDDARLRAFHQGKVPDSLTSI
jgi:hypothetical protein